MKYTEEACTDFFNITLFLIYIWDTGQVIWLWFGVIKLLLMDCIYWVDFCSCICDFLLIMICSWIFSYFVFGDLFDFLGKFQQDVEL